MFKWQEDIDHLDIPANRILRLHQSQNEVQIALPGFPSQDATAYVCAFSVKLGLRVTIALHLKISHRIAFFFHRTADTSRSAKDLLQEALDYAESMGFSLADCDYHLLTEAQREQLWSELPLSEGDHEEDPDDILETLDEIEEEPQLEIVEEPIEEISEIPEEIEDIIEDVTDAPGEIEDVVEEIEITLDDESLSEPEEGIPPVVETQKEPATNNRGPHLNQSPTERFGRFLSSF